MFNNILNLLADYYCFIPRIYTGLYSFKYFVNGSTFSILGERSCINAMKTSVLNILVIQASIQAIVYCDLSGLYCSFVYYCLINSNQDMMSRQISLPEMLEGINLSSIKLNITIIVSAGIEASGIKGGQ